MGGNIPFFSKQGLSKQGPAQVGQMSKKGSFSLARPMRSSKTFENEKVEAMTTYKNGILLLTDNENFGSSRYFISISKLL